MVFSGPKILGVINFSSKSSTLKSKWPLSNVCENVIKSSARRLVRKAIIAFCGKTRFIHAFHRPVYELLPGNSGSRGGSRQKFRSRSFFN